MSRLLVSLFLAGAFALWSPPSHADTSLNKDCDDITPVGGSQAPMHTTNGSAIRSAGQTPDGRCQNQMTPKFKTSAPPAVPVVPAAAAVPEAPAPAPAESASPATHLDMDEEIAAPPSRNPWMSSPQEDSLGSDHWRYPE